MNKAIVIIPARGGSKRIPGKNIRSFCGKSMICYAIEAAKNSGCFERVVVSTDDPEIANIARACGAEVPFMRPQELADDFTGTVPVMAHAIKACADLGWHAKYACCIYPGVPFILEQDLQEAAALMQASNADYVFPVAAFPSAIQRALKRSSDGHVSPFHPEFTQTRTQDLEPAYHDAGQFYFGKAEAWLRGASPHQTGVGMIIPQWRVVDIDTPEDWERAERLFKCFNEPQN